MRPADAARDDEIVLYEKTAAYSAEHTGGSCIKNLLNKV